MRVFFREKVMAAVCCLLGMAACLMMWREAGLDHPGRPLHLFGDSKRIPFWERRFPETHILFAGCGYGMVILSIFGLMGRRDDSPEFLHGPAFIFVGVLFGVFLTQARTVNGTAMEVVQPGFYLALAANGGLVVAGVMILVRAGWSGKTAPPNPPEA